MFDTAAVKELKEQAKLIGGLYGKAHLGDISIVDLNEVVHNSGVRADLRKAYAEAVTDVGERKAMKAAVSTARRWAEAYARQGRTNFGDTLVAAENAIRGILAPVDR